MHFRKFAAVMVAVLAALPIFNVNAQVTMAVLDFENSSIFDRDQWEPLKGGLAQMLITEMDVLESVQIVERRRLNQLLDEIKLSQSGVLDERKSAQIGKLSGARYMVFGSYLVGMDNKMRIDIRIVHVETGQTVKAAEKTGKSKDFLKLMRKLVKDVIDDLAIPVSDEEKNRYKDGKAYDVKALLAYSEAVALEDAGEVKAAGRAYKALIDAHPEFDPARARLDAIVAQLRAR